MNKVFYFCFILTSNLFIISETICMEPYRSINTLPADWHGWFSPENQKNLEELIAIRKPKCIIELGSWLGLSARFMASRMPDDGKLYAVDDWTADTDIAIKNTPGMNLKIPTLYQQFLSNIKHANLCNKIIPIRMKTDEAAKALSVSADLIYIDASHDEESVFKDIMNWYPKLNKNGIMCGDDWLYSEGVRNAVTKTAKLLNKTIKTDGNFWYFILNIPVIFIHKNDSDYLKDTLWQAKQYNENVILLGDPANQHYSQIGIDWQPISKYSKEANYFDTIYIDLSDTSFEFARFCFQRWFILEEFMKANNLQVCFYCDSDAMIYTDITQEYKNFLDFDMSVLFVEHHGGCFSYWNQKAISSFCDYIKKFYEDKIVITKLKEQFNSGTLDQFYADHCPFLTDFVNYNKYNLKIGNINSIINDSTFDTYLRYDFTWEPNHNKICRFVAKNVKIEGNKNKIIDKIKDIVWINNLPYCYNIDLGKMIRFKGLHFQDQCKKIVSEYRKEKV